MNFRNNIKKKSKCIFYKA